MSLEICLPRLIGASPPIGGQPAQSAIHDLQRCNPWQLAIRCLLGANASCCTLADNSISACSQESAHHHWTAAHAHGCSTPVVHFSEFGFSSATTIALPFCQNKALRTLCRGALVQIRSAQNAVMSLQKQPGRYKWVLLTWHNAALVIILSLP